MAIDYPSSLPVRTEVDADERLQSKVVDYTDPTRGQTVDTDGNAHVEMHGNNPAGGDETLALSELGRVNSDGVYDATNNTKPAHAGLIGHTRGATPVDADCGKRITAISSGTVHALDVAIRDEEGNAFSNSNPLPVAPGPIAGTRVHDFNTEEEVAKNAASNHDYTVAGTALDLYSVEASGSGKAKFSLQISLDGIAFTTVGVKFNSTANPNVAWDFGDVPVSIPVAGIVRVIRTNKDNGDSDLYSTIVGVKA
jgi:hypothetical protein